MLLSSIWSAFVIGRVQKKKNKAWALFLYTDIWVWGIIPSVQLPLVHDSSDGNAIM